MPPIEAAVTHRNETSRRFAELRQKLGLSQADFAARLGAEDYTIKDIERGKQSVTIELLQSTVETFPISAEWLLTGHGFWLRSGQSPQKAKSG